MGPILTVSFLPNMGNLVPTTSRKSTSPTTKPRESASFLVRLWVEPRPDGGDGEVRVFVRNLGNGRELQCGAPEALPQSLLEQLHAAPSVGTLLSAHRRIAASPSQRAAVSGRDGNAGDERRPGLDR